MEPTTTRTEITCKARARYEPALGNPGDHSLSGAGRPAAYCTARAALRLNTAPLVLFEDGARGHCHLHTGHEPCAAMRGWTPRPAAQWPLAPFPSGPRGGAAPPGNAMASASLGARLSDPAGAGSPSGRRLRPGPPASLVGRRRPSLRDGPACLDALAPPSCGGGSPPCAGDALHGLQGAVRPDRRRNGPLPRPLRVRGAGLRPRATPWPRLRSARGYLPPLGRGRRLADGSGPALSVAGWP